ncbi:metallophosphoesterase [Burkholderia pyrrocinia]|uniref:Metallophosphoesterase n=1 Tax=Burkholderia pyrrocinia TaxID=60550 RepID=A0ABZ3BQC3_BURPY
MKEKMLRWIISFGIVVLIGVIAAEPAYSDNETGTLPRSSWFAFTSDPQFPWTDKTDEGVSETEEAKKARSRELITQQYDSINSLKRELGDRLAAVLVNGDLTAFGHWSELQTYYNELLPRLKPRVFIGLGNHDYGNNVDDCFENRCATDSVRKFVDWARQTGVTNMDIYEHSDYTFPSLATLTTGSLAYSVDIGDVHVIQLNNYAGYSRTWEGFVSAEARKFRFEISPSTRWLERDLALARQKGQIIIVNMHQPEIDGLSNLLSRYGVTAVFTGHFHGSSGNSWLFAGVPAFTIGSASQSTWLLAELDRVEKKLRVYGVERNDPTKKRLIRVLDVIQDVGSAPVPAPDYHITFFNSGGYVARYSVSWNVDGKPSTVSTGALLLGNKRTFLIPGNATEIQAFGENWTGLVWEPLRTIFDVRVLPTGKNQCFKTWGTTLNAAWNQSEC